MKRIILITAVAFTILTSSVIARNLVSIRSTSNCLIQLKFVKSMFGASVRVIDCAGNVVFSEMVHSRRVHIDLFDMASGIYFVTIEKGDMVETFSYEIIDPEED